jgi:micrococcal nuclease
MSPARLFRALPTSVQVVLVLLVVVGVAAGLPGPEDPSPAQDDHTEAQRATPTAPDPSPGDPRPETEDPRPGDEPGPAPVAAAPAPNAQPIPAGDDAEVVDVIDGDTLLARVAGREQRVRLIGINTPETVHPHRGVECFGREASAHTARLVGPGTAVRLVYDIERTDRFGRTLAYLYRLGDGLFVNLALVRDGYAQVATSPPNVAHAQDFLVSQREAREAGRGLWSACVDVGDRSAPPAHGAGTCTAAMSDPTPARYSTTVVRISSNLPGRPVDATAHYRTTRRTNSGTTGPDGSAAIEFRIGGATAGVTVIVEVDIGDGAATCETSFTPR